MKDLIERQAAIDAIVAWTVEDRPDVEMPTDLIDRIKELPSAQPKIVRCKDCKYWDTDYGLYGFCGRHGWHFSTYREGYCYMADRRQT